MLGRNKCEKWTKHKFNMKLVNPANKRKYDIIVVGSGLAGASAAASFGELGYNVKCFCFQDSPRRAHSIAAQGGINAAKNYPGDGDSIYRLFYDTIKGGDYRAREANVYRLAEVSNDIIDQCVAQGVPFAREYSGYLDNRSFGGAQVSRTFYARGQTGQQLLLGAYGALSKEINKRQDIYGGSLENRSRIVFEIIEGIRKACGTSFLIGVRLSPERFGMDLNEIKILAQNLIDTNLIDFLDISLWDCFKMPEDLNYQDKTLLDHFTGLNFKDVKLTVAGKISSGHDVHEILKNKVDFVTIGRSAILHHDFPHRVMENPNFKPEPLPVSKSYLKKEGLSNSFIEYMNRWPNFVQP